MVMGEKGKAQLQRDMKPAFAATVADTQKQKITYAQASSIAEEILATEYDATRIIYNRFFSAISFKPTIATILSPDVSRRRDGRGGARGRAGRSQQGASRSQRQQQK